MPTFFDPTARFTREAVQLALGIKNVEKGGEWATGYREYNGEFFVFATVGQAGRTGHQYENRWVDGVLLWEAKNQTTIEQPQIRQLIGGQKPVHVFTRADDRAAFSYMGVATAKSVEDSQPVKVAWQFDSSWRRPMSPDQLVEALRGLGFKVSDPGVKSQKAELNGLTIYIKRESASLVAVISGDLSDLVERLRVIPGVRRPLPNDYFVHNQSFTGFPKRKHKGEDLRPFGFDFDFYTEAALLTFVRLASGEVVEPDVGELKFPDEPTVDPETETEEWRARRLGQAKFRQKLIDRWRGQCALTGLAIRDILRASHIKPWCESSNQERLDPDNGLLLVVHIDCLFDRGLVSFRDDGALILSERLDAASRSALGVRDGLGIDGLSEGNRRYLRLHRSKYFGL